MRWIYLFEIKISLSTDRYRVDDVTQDSREDCYLASLHISETDSHDSRPYYLVVENDRGIDRHAIHLNVEGTFTGAFKQNFYFAFIQKFLFEHKLSYSIGIVLIVY